MDDTFASAIGEMWPVWRPQELARVAVLERAAAKGAELTEDERREAQEESHRLAGTLAALGRSDAANGARELERRFLIGDVEGLAALVEALRAAVESPPLGSPP